MASADAPAPGELTPTTLLHPEGNGSRTPEAPQPQTARTSRAALWTYTYGPLALILALAGSFRLYGLGRVGFNADEAVYASQAASIAGLDQYKTLFPVFRAHPLLFQMTLSLLFKHGVTDVGARALAATFGVATVWITYLIGARIYGRRAGLVAAAILAVMPYHVIVTRQVLLDGPMVMYATLTLYCAVRYAQDRSDTRWIIGAMVMMALTFLSKETSILLLGGLLVFLFITPVPKPDRTDNEWEFQKFYLAFRRRQGNKVSRALVRAPVRFWRRHHVLRSLGTIFAISVFVSMILALPLSIAMSGRKGTGTSYLAWQLFRRANHSYWFYAQTVPEAIGVLVVALMLLAVARTLISSRRHHKSVDPAEKLLLCWAVVPILAFEAYPVKGFQYLLPVAPVAAVLAASQIVKLPGIKLGSRKLGAIVVQVTAAAVVLASLAWPSWEHINPSPSSAFVAGSGGVPQGREAGEFIAANLPIGAQLLTIGPSMANIIMWYSQRQTFGLSVSPNPLNRNPSYAPVDNPDSSLRQGTIQYLVWDVYSANRSPHFATKLMGFVSKYHAALIHSFTITVKGKNGTSQTPVIEIYEVRLP